jgi:hypothetical protein
MIKVTHIYCCIECERCLLERGMLEVEVKEF